jgi:UDP-glucose 4-epimerase
MYRQTARDGEGLDLNKPRLKGSTILVLGGAGFIGSHLTERLLDTEAAKIIVGDSFFLGNSDNLVFDQASVSSEIEVVRIDASDYAALSSLVISRGIDFVFNLAVIPLPTSLEFPSWTVSSNIAITTNCCELVRNGLVHKLFHLSSSEVYGSASYVPMDEDHAYNPSTPYAASKVAGDQIVLSYIHTFGIEAQIARPFNNYGPKQNSRTYAGIIPIIVNNVLEGKEIQIYGDGEQTRDYVYVVDTCAHIIALASLSTAVDKAVNIATGVETSVNSLVERIFNLMGQITPVVYLPGRAGDVRRHSGDPSLLRELTADSPSPLSDKNLIHTIDWYRKIWHDDQVK